MIEKLAIVYFTLGTLYISIAAIAMPYKYFSIHQHGGYEVFLRVVRFFVGYALWPFVMMWSYVQDKREREKSNAV